MSKKSGLLHEFSSGFKSGWGLWGASGVRNTPFFTSSTMRSSSIRNAAERDHQQTMNLYMEVKEEFEASPFADAEAADTFMYELVIEACSRAERIPSIPLGEALFETIRQLLIEEGSLFGFPEVDWSQRLGLEEGVLLRKYLNRKRRFLQNHEYLTRAWREKVIRMFEGVIAYLPDRAFDDGGDEKEETAALTFSTPFLDCLEDPAEVIERIVVTMFDDDILSLDLFEDVRHRTETNTLLASGIDPDARYEKLPKIVWPTQLRGKSYAELVEAFLRETPFETLFSCELPFEIPDAVRFEHCHVVGGTGHGKTQLLQHLIHSDLLKVREGKASVVVIDSQGDLIRTISHLSYFGSEAERSLSDKFVLIDPNDIEYPVALNMFDVNMKRLESYSLIDREKILNGTIELYEYIFGALLGAELTQKQGVIFRYLARLMLAIPDATVQTLRELMEDGKPFKPYMQGLKGTSRKFFETQFFQPSFNSTKSQILKRLWGVLSNTTFERMFSNPHNKIGLFDAMNSGKVILINTAKDLLKQEGCEIFGRFFIAMIAQAAMERATIPKDKRMDTFVYIDEAQDYFDEHIEQLLNQARKYRIGMHLAHQNLGQLAQFLKSSIAASTSIKMAGGVSANDAKAFAQEMRCDAEFIHGTRKHEGRTEFACWVKNFTPQAIKISVPLGSVEQLPTISDSDYETLISKNRVRYSTTLEKVERFIEAEPPPAPIVIEAPDQKPVPEPEVSRAAHEPSPPEPTLHERVQKAALARRKLFEDEPQDLGRGGKEHTYAQNLVKQFAEDRHFRAVIEQSILDGTGRVDVALKRDDVSIACEISITTSPEHELANVEKCLIAGFEKVLVISPDPKHLKRIKRYVETHLEKAYKDRVRFLNTEGVIAHLDQIEATSAAREETVRGYKVKVTHRSLDPSEREEKRKAISKVISRSLKKIRDADDEPSQL